MTRRGLPPDVRWPVKASELRSCLGDLATDVRIVHMTWKKKASDTPLVVDWAPRRSDSIGALPPGLDGPASVWLAPVAREQQPQIAEQLRRHALPDLADWLRRAFTAPQTWQDARHERRWVITATGLRTVDDDGLHILDRDRG